MEYVEWYGDELILLLVLIKSVMLYVDFVKGFM